MENSQEISVLKFSNDTNAQVLIDSLSELANVSICAKKENKYIFSDVYEMDKKEYKQKNQTAKEVLLAFCVDRSGLKDICDPTTKEGLAQCFSMSGQFVSIYNSIISRTISNIILNANSPVITNFCDIQQCEVGGSISVEIDPKGLPVAQRGSYMSNVALLDSFTKTSVIVTPKVYSIGTQMDYIRILDGGFDIGREIARITMAIIWAQYRLVVQTLFDSTPIAGTPFYSATYSGSIVVDTVEVLQAVNGGSPVKAYGALSAFNRAGLIDTQGIGFATQDDLIRDGYLSHANGIANIALPQATDASIAFTNANINKLLLLPKDNILLISDAGKKLMTMARENLVRITSTPALEGGLYRQTYSYFMSFDVQMASQANYGIIKIAKN